MLDGAALAATLAALPVTSLSSVLYRAVTRRALVGDPPYPTVRPLFDLGAPQRGARYTPVGGMRSLYLTEDPETALAEVNQAYAKLRRQNPPIMAAIPCGEWCRASAVAHRRRHSEMRPFKTAISRPCAIPRLRWWAVRAT